MKFLSVILMMGLGLTSAAQDVSLALQKPKRPSSETLNKQWENTTKGLNVSFTSSNVRFAKEVPPEVSVQNTWNAPAWKGEKIHTQLLLWANNNVANLSIKLSDLKDQKGNDIKKENITVGIIKYVITDEFKDGCGYRKAADFDSSYVADLIDTKTNNIAVNARSTKIAKSICPIFFQKNQIEMYHF